MSEQEASASSTGSAWIKKIGGIAVVVALVIGWRMWNKSGDSTEVADAIKTWVVATPAYAGNKDYMDGVFKANHDKAFDASYTQRRRRTSFDSEKYARLMWTGMIADAKSGGKADVAAALEKAYDEFRKGQAEGK